MVFTAFVGGGGDLFSNGVCHLYHTFFIVAINPKMAGYLDGVADIRGIGIWIFNFYFLCAGITAGVCRMERIY